MKMIVNGKLYDTETSDCIADRGMGLSKMEHSSEFTFWGLAQALCRTKNGAWFLYRRGVLGDEDIIGLTPDEVVTWAEQTSITSDEHEAIAKALGLEEA